MDTLKQKLHDACKTCNLGITDRNSIKYSYDIGDGEFDRNSKAPDILTHLKKQKIPQSVVQLNQTP